MLVMVVFFIAFRWIHLSTPLIRLFLLVLILLLMPTLNFLPVWLALSLLLLFQWVTFTGAADWVDMTLSFTIHVLSALESDFVVRLLERHRPAVTPTAVGSDVLAHARAMLAESEHIRQMAAAARGLAA